MDQVLQPLSLQVPEEASILLPEQFPATEQSRQTEAPPESAAAPAEEGESASFLPAEALTSRHGTWQAEA